MKLVIAQGNPGTEYAKTRHNIGWSMLDAYAAEREVTFKAQPKFKADIAELSVNGEKILLVKPTTFYNLTGESAALITHFYKIAPEDVLILHDELALPLGTLRTRIGGSDAGNNGVKSLNQHLGPATARIRIGVWNDTRDHMDDAAFVLSAITRDEQTQLDDLQPTVFRYIDAFIDGKFTPTTLS